MLEHPRSTLALLTILWLAHSAHAQSTEVIDRGPLEFRARVAFGAGSHESSLPTRNGDERVAPHAFAAWGFELRAVAAVSERLRLGGAVDYASSLGYQLTRPIFSATAEASAARSQDLGAHALAEITLARMLRLPISLGYAFSAFSSDVPLVAAPSYLLSGPRLAAGLQLLLFDARLSVLALPELGAVVTASDTLANLGVARHGLEYGWTAELDVRLPYRLQLGVRYREVHTGLHAVDSSSLRDSQRFVLGSVGWRND